MNHFSNKRALLLRLSHKFLASLLSFALLIAPGAALAKGGGGGGGGTPLFCTFTGTISTDWATAGNWDCGRVPLSIDRATIPLGQSAESAGAGAVATDVFVNLGGSLTISGGTFTAQGSLQNAGTFLMTGGTVIMEGANNSGSMELDGGTLNTDLGNLGNTGTLSGSGIATILQVPMLVNFGTINHTGGWQIRIGSSGFGNFGTYNAIADSSVLRFTGSGSTIPTNINYPNLELGGALSLPDDSRLTSLGNVTLLTGLAFSANSSTIAVPGNWVAQAGSAISNNHTTIEFTGSATSTITVDPTGAMFYDIKINKDVSDKGVQLLSNATATDALVITQGLFDENGYTLALPQSCLFVGITTNWEDPNNWNCAGIPRLPSITDFVTIPTLQTPVITTGEMGPAPSIGHLAIESGASLEVQGPGMLTVYGTSTNAGTISINGIGGGSGVLRFYGGLYATSTNTGTITAVSGGALTFYAPLDNPGTLDVSGGGKLILAVNMGTVGGLIVSGLGELKLIGAGDTVDPPTRFVPAVSPIGTLTIGMDINDFISLEASATTTSAVNITSGKLSLNGKTLSLDGTAALTSAAGTGSFMSGSGVIAFTGSGDQTITSSFTLYMPTLLISKTSGQVSQSASQIIPNLGFQVASGTYLVSPGGYFQSYGFSTIAASATVTSTGATTYFSGGLNNQGILSINGTMTVTGGVFTNDGTFQIGPGADAIADSLTNNGTITGNTTGGGLTLLSNFAKGPESTFNPPNMVVFNGPSVIPAYSYHDVYVYQNTNLQSNNDTLAFNNVFISGAALTIQNTGSLQSDLNLSMGMVTIDALSSLNFSGTSVGPTVTTTGVLTNNGTLTLNNASLSMMDAFSGSGIFDFANSDLTYFGNTPASIPSATYERLSLLGNGTYTLSASTTVMATTTIASTAVLDLSTYRFNALSDIVNTGLITSSTGAVLHHPVDYLRFSDASGNAITSLADGGSLYITLKDQGRNLNGGIVETIPLTATSTAPAGSDAEDLMLTETSPSSGIFRNTSAIPVLQTAATTLTNGTLEIVNAGEGHTTYLDTYDDSNSTSAIVTLTATASAPTILLGTTSTTTNTATVHWTTDVSATAKVIYGPSTSYASTTSETNIESPTTTHEVTLSDLVPCSTYHYAVVSRDTTLIASATSTDASFTTTGCVGNATIVSESANTISTGGGTTTSTHEGTVFSVHLPTGFSVTSSEVELQIKVLGSSAVLGSIGAPTSLSGVGTIVFDVSALMNPTTLLDTFDAPITITLHYTNADVASLDESTFWIYHYHNGAWVRLNDCVVDAAANTITCTTQSFSTFALFGQAASVPSSGSGGGGGSMGGGGAVGNITLWDYTTPRASAPPVSVPVSSAPAISVPSPVFVSNPIPAPATPATLRNTQGDAKSFGIQTTALTEERLASFIDHGSNAATIKLGSGERRALVRDLLDTMRTADVTIEDLERVASGLIPLHRNLAQERIQLPRARSAFRAIYGHDPKFQNAQENLAWNTLLYRIRFPRNLTREQRGVLLFRQTFHRIPQDPFQWATVRVMGYVR